MKEDSIEAILKMLSHNLVDRWGATDDLATSSLHSSRLSAFLMAAPSVMNEEPDSLFMFVVSTTEEQFVTFLGGCFSDAFPPYFIHTDS